MLFWMSWISTPLIELIFMCDVFWRWRKTISAPWNSKCLTKCLILNAPLGNPNEQKRKDMIKKRVNCIFVSIHICMQMTDEWEIYSYLHLGNLIWPIHFWFTKQRALNFICAPSPSPSIFYTPPTVQSSKNNAKNLCSSYKTASSNAA